ncbi:LacI family DNA-binding transcriptional regulator [Steroidobacter sp. S1-65]|uniref:LacI family DNA-binding transcriptional regulator n=1 Tax=Steroidobacter gossypii TaxID=2805490 RepID=A0ABS1WRX6_9GAMM|nr:LacI family DNA-binding transcriptional regulator [Steroidobacter gossypii]MBM0103725.1 LacI family DNA-binding transcriptional regulator [Steroidobacter gossypii]
MSKRAANNNLKKRAMTAAPDSPPTLEMVAKEAGVSIATVSRIINGTAKVSPERKDAVEAAIAKLNFRPNAAARGLALGKSNTIGVITQAIDSPFYGEGLRGIEDYLQQRGYTALFMSGNWDEQDEERCMSELLSRRVDGIIIFSGRLQDRQLAQYAKQVPLVVTARNLKAPGIFSLPVDDERGGMLATQHLIGLGHRRIAFIAGILDHPDASLRYKGYRRALAEAGIPHDPKLVVPGDFHEEGGVEATRRLLASGHKFTALFCVNDQSAYGACLALYRAGLNCPRDVSVVGFDDLHSSSYRVPPLTTVRQSIRVLGESSGAAMLQLLQGEQPNISLPQVQLVVRESTAAPQPD